MLNTPNAVTLLRIVLIPLFVVVYYLPFAWVNELTTTLFVLAAITDWLDGYLARRLNQTSTLGAFLDPVADKLMVAAALVLLVADNRNQELALSAILFTVVILVIIGREISISALREWMAELGERSSVAVSYIGKIKTTIQMTAIGFLLYREPLFGVVPIFRIGEVLLYAAGILTLWSMVVYLRSAWPVIRNSPMGP